MTTKFLLNLLGFNPDLTSRQSRSDSLSLVSRQSDLLTYVGRIAAILVLCLTIGVGNAWGADTQVYSTGFENTTTDTQYQGTVTCTTAQGDGATWQIYYGNFTTDAYVSGSKCAQMRLYKDGNCGTLTQTSDIANVDSIRFAYKPNNTNVRFKVSYSTNSGSTWTDLQTGLGGGTTTEYFKYKLATRAAKFRLKITITGGHPSSSNRKLSIDDIVYKTVSSCSSPGSALAVSAAETTVYADTKTQLSTTGGNGSTVSYSVISANSTYATIDGSNMFSASRAGTYTVQASQDDNGGTCGGTATVDITVRYQVKWSVNGNDSYSTGSPTTYIGTHNTKVSTLPTAPTSAMCDNTKVFVGWTTSSYSHATNAPTTLFLTAASSPNVTDNVTYYAVFANRTDFTRVTSTSQLAAGKQIVVVDDQNSKVLTTAPGYATAPTESSSKITPSNNMIWTLEANSTNWKLKTSGSYLGASSTSNGTSVSLTSTNSIWTIGASSSGTNNFYLLNTGGTNLCLEYYSSGSSWVVYANKNYTSSTYFTEKLYVATLTNYATSCCTKLGTINGSISWTNPTEAVLTWNSMSNVHASTPYTIKYKTHDAGAYTTFDGSITTNGSGKKTCTITGLSCNTAYDFKIEVTAASGYCDKDSAMENKNSGKWSVTYNLENVSKTSGPDAGANVCGDYSAVFEANSGSALPSSITVTGASSYTWTKATGSLSISSANITGNLTITIVGACTAFSLHTGTKNGSDWVTNKCFGDADWGASDDAIWEGEFPSTNEYYVGWQGGGSMHGDYWAVGGIKTYDIPTGRTLGWNSSDYYNDFPARALGTFHIYKNSTEGNYYLRFKPEAYVLRTGTDGTGWTSTAMTKSASNDKYYETDFITLTEDLINEHAYVDLKANNVNGHVWCNFSSDDVAEGNVKVKASPGDESSNFRATDLADGDVGMYGKFRIDISQDENNWKLAFVPFYHVTYNGSGASGSTAASAYVEKGSTVSAAANGFTVPTGKTFAGWATSSSRASAGTVDYAAGASVTVNADTELFAVWNWINYSVTVNKSGCASATVDADKKTNVHYGETVTLSADEPAGYAFVNWTTSDGVTFSPNATTKGATFTMPASNVTVQANYHQIYTITWSVNGSALTGDALDGADVNVEQGSNLSGVPSTAPADNSLNNCANKFMGWSKKDAGSTPKTTSYYDDLFTSASEFVDGGGTITENTTFYAVFAESVESGTYSDGTTHVWTGSTDGYSDWGGSMTKSWLRNKCAILPTFEYTPDYNVKKVVLNVRQTNNTGSNTVAVSVGGTAIGSATAVTGNNVVYNMEFDHGTGTPLSGKVRIVATNTSTDPSCNTTGLGTFELNSITLYEGDPDITYINYVTQCADNQVRVTYDANGGRDLGCTSGVTTKNASYTVCSTEPTRNYYEFSGWNDGTSTYDAGDSYNLSTNTTFTAQWTPTTYYITYELDGGTNNVGNPATYNVTTATITLQDPTRGHDRFEGWYSTYSEGIYSDQVTEIPIGSHGDITLYAKWAERHEIIFDADGDKTTIYRAEDENMEDAVAGQGSVPSDPSAPTACSSKVFVGWSESEIDGETDTEPGDLMKPAAGTVNADKHYYAVWATESSESGAVEVFSDSFYGKADNNSPVSSYGKWTLSTVLGTGTSSEGVRLSSGTYGASMDLDLSDKTLESTITIKFKIKKYSSVEDGTVTFDCLDEGATPTFSPSSFNDPTTSWVEKTCTVTGVDNKVKSINISGAKDKQVYFKDFVITQTGTIYSYSAYSTSCCATKVTLSHNSPSNGTVAFGKTTVPTCDEDKDVSLTITPATGYQLTGWTVNTASGYADAKSTSPAVVTNNNSNAAQNITLTFAEDAIKDYDVTATFGEMVVTGWNWTMHEGGSAIPSRVDIYVGQSVRLDVAYIPSGVLSSHKVYVRTKDDKYINWPAGAQPSGYSTIVGKASTGDNTTDVVYTNSEGSLTETVKVKVLPLPLTHFEDLIHGKSFDDVVATIVDNALSATKTTPTSDDWTTPNANSCEENHLHLVGWIREDWPALVAYLNGTGDAPTTTAIVGAGNDGSGHAYYIAAGASINVQTFDGVTFYAVWAEIK